MGFPPAEERDESLVAMGIVDMFGSGWRPQHLVHMKELEEDSKDAMFIVLSDVQLDNPNVCEKLQEVFNGFEGIEGNLVFVLIGSFITKPVAVPGGRQTAEQAFRQLGDMIRLCPGLAQNARFVLVP
ncbi:DPB2, partial [Symbiodinium microadriaticum]